MLKVGLIGYGKMGQMLHDLAPSFNLDVKVIIDPEHTKATAQDITEESLKNCDVCIDFTTPKVVLDNIEKLLKLNVPVVVGTTGWYEQLPKVKDLVHQYDGTLIYGSNFSIGVNVFFKMLKEASRIMNQIPGYDVSGYESHHRMKKDIPSGTAKSIADIVLSEINGKNSVIYQPGNRQIQEDELHFTSLRCGHINGLHEITFDSFEDQIKLKHRARNRQGFAKGALVAAKYCANHSGLIDFNQKFDEILKEMSNGN